MENINLTGLENIAAEAHNYVDILKRLNTIYYKIETVDSALVNIVTLLDIKAARSQKEVDRIELSEMVQTSSGIKAILDAMTRVKETAAYHTEYTATAKPYVDEVESIRSEHDALTNQIKIYIEDLHSKLSLFVTELEQSKVSTDPRAALEKQEKSLRVKIDNLIDTSYKLKYNLNKLHKDIYNLLPPAAKKDVAASLENKQQPQQT